MRHGTTYSLLILVLFIGIVTRFYELGKVPVGPDWDEAAIGYNAYSLLSTGKDEFGQTIPLVFRSFNDYKPPLYIYLTIPSVALFGLNTWSVRLPSVLMGILAILGTYFLTHELVQFVSVRASSPSRGSYSNFQQPFGRHSLESIGLSLIPIIASALLAISPWHIQFSRVAFEANVGVTFNIWGTFFFFRGLRSPKYFYIASILFALGMYTYHTERLFVPLYLLLLGIVFRKDIFRNKKELLISSCIGFIMVVPIVSSFFGSKGLERLSSTSIFRMQTEFLDKSVQKSNWDKEHGSVVGQLLNDRRIEWTKIFVSGYLSHFSPRWLFVTGDYPRHHAPDSGLLYLWTAPFLGIGLLVVLGEFKLLRKYLIGWLLLSPLAASFTFEVPHAVRTLVFLPAFDIIISFGIWKLLSFIYFLLRTTFDRRKKVLLTGLVFCLSLFSVFETLRFFDLYFVHMNAEYSQYWQYGYEDTVRYTEAHKSDYQRIIVSTALEQPYIFFLFFTKYPPSNYLAQGGSEVKDFGKYIFRSIDWKNEKVGEKTLYIDTYKNSPNSNKLVIKSMAGESLIALRDK